MRAPKPKAEVREAEVLEEGTEGAGFYRKAAKLAEFRKEFLLSELRRHII